MKYITSQADFLDLPLPVLIAKWWLRRNAKRAAITGGIIIDPYKELEKVFNVASMPTPRDVELLTISHNLDKSWFGRLLLHRVIFPYTEKLAEAWITYDEAHIAYVGVVPDDDKEKGGDSVQD